MNDYDSIHSSLAAESPVLDYTRIQRRVSDGVELNWQHVYAAGRWNAHWRVPMTPLAVMDGVTLSAFLASYGLPIPNLNQLVLARALEKATGSDALAMVTAAELDKTVDLVRSCASLVNKSCLLLESLGLNGRRALNELLRLKRIRKWNRKRILQEAVQKFGKPLASAASLWLGYRYGIMATYYDISSWVEADAAGRRVRVTSSSLDTRKGGTDWTVVDNFNDLTYSERSVWSRRSTVSAGVLIDPKRVSTADVYGANRVLASAWELIPFSFVVDWIADTGTRLAAAEGEWLVRPLGSWIKLEHEIDRSYGYRTVYKDQVISGVRHYAYGNDSGACTEKSVLKQRIANPTLSFFPRPAIRLNWKRLTDSLALLTPSQRRLGRLARNS